MFAVSVTIPHPLKAHAADILQRHETGGMMSLNFKRLFGRWAFGPFLIAQLAGIVPLFGVHLQHAMASEQDIADDVGGNGAAGHAHHHHVHRGSGHHDHGAADPNDQCCTLHHHLAGVLPAATGNPNSDPVVAIVWLPPRAFVPADPGLLERPPKLLLSI